MKRSKGNRTTEHCIQGPILNHIPLQMQMGQFGPLKFQKQVVFYVKKYI